MVPQTDLPCHPGIGTLGYGPENITKQQEPVHLKLPYVVHLHGSWMKSVSAVMGTDAAWELLLCYEWEV